MTENRYVNGRDVFSLPIETKDHKEYFGEYKDDFKLVYLLRNRKSHPSSKSKRRDWRDIQKYIADILRRRRPVYKDTSQELDQGMYHPNDMKLTALEGMEVKIHLLEKMCRGLDLLRRKADWDS